MNFELLLQIVLLTAGFIMLIKGADYLVDGASAIAMRFGISQLIVGLTVVAMGTSAPETAVSLAAALKGSADLPIANVVGSNIMNVLVILGLTAFIAPLVVEKSTIRIELPYMIAITVLLLITGLNGEIAFIDGVFLVGAFLLYLGYLLVSALRGQEDKSEEEDAKKVSIIKAVFMTVLGIVLIVGGSNLTVDAASAIARYIGISERFIGLTIVALGTSLPELFTSVTAARKGNADLAIGNIVGSNIFNILFVVGVSSLIVPIAFDRPFIFDTLCAIGSGVILWLCSFRKHRLGRLAGLFMLACYVGYFYTLL